MKKVMLVVIIIFVMLSSISILNAKQPTVDDTVLWTNTKFVTENNITIISPKEFITCSIAPDGINYDNCSIYFQVINNNSDNVHLKLNSLTKQWTKNKIKSDSEVIYTTNNCTLENVVDYSNLKNNTAVEINNTYMKFYGFQEDKSKNVKLKETCGIRIDFQKERWQSDSFNITIKDNNNISLVVLDPDVSACGTLDTPDSVYTLTQNINSSGHCIVIGANNVTLNGNGFTLNFSQNASGLGDNGIEISNYNYTTIANLTIVQGSTYLGGGWWSSIYGTNTNNLTLINNNITVLSNEMEGIWLTNSSDSNITNNVIRYTGSALGMYAIELDGSTEKYCTNIIIANNTAYGGEQYAINFDKVNYSIILNNNLSGGHADSSTQGTVGLYNSNFITISNNFINTTGLGYFESSGIDVHGDSHIISNNEIVSTGLAEGDYDGYIYGIWMNGATNVTIFNNNITTAGYSSGIMLDYFNSVNITKNNISTTGYPAIDFASVWVSLSEIQFINVTMFENTEHGLPILFLKDNSSISVQNNNSIGEIIIVNSSNLLFDNISMSYSGIIIFQSNNLTVKNSNSLTSHFLTTYDVNNTYIFNNTLNNTGAFQTLELNTGTNGTINNNTFYGSSSAYSSMIYLTSLQNYTISNNIINTSGTNANGIYFDNSNATTIINNTIFTVGSSYLGIKAYSSNYSTVIFNNVTTYGTSSKAISESGSNNNMSNNIFNCYRSSCVFTTGSSDTFSNNIIYTNTTNGNGLNSRNSNSNITYNNITSAVSGSGTHALLLTIATGNNVIGNNITSFSSAGAGVYVYSGSNNNIFTNNTVYTTNGNGYAFLFHTNSVNNNVSGGSIISKSSYDYALINSGYTNNFFNTNFTSTRKIYTDITSSFNFQNTSNTDVKLVTKLSADTYATRKLNTWTNTTMKWNDTNNTATVTATYNISNLWVSSNYTVYNTTGSSQTIVNRSTDANGVLQSFTAKLTGNTEIYIVLIDTVPPTYSQLNVSSAAIKRNDTVDFSVFWSDSYSTLSTFILSTNNTGPWVNETTTAMSGNWSNFTKQITANKSTEVDWKIYGFDSAGNMNVTTQQNFTTVNSVPIVTASIFPSPATSSNDLNCTFAYYDIDDDLEVEHWFQWYINDVLNNYTTQNLTSGNFSGNENIICSIKANDGTDNSSWTNSSTLTLGDTTPPVIQNDSLSTNSGYTNNAFTIFVNTTEANVMDWVRVEVTTPVNDTTNKTMRLESHVGDDWRYNYSYTPNGDGIYTFNFYAKDGSGNLNNYTSNLNFSATVYVAPSAAPGGGGDRETTCNQNHYCNIGETIANCPNDCVFPLSLSPNNATVTTYFGYPVSSSFTLYNNVNWDVQTEIYFKPTKNDTKTYNLSRLEFSGQKYQNVSSKVLAKSTLSPGYIYFTIVSDLPDDKYQGNYTLVISAQGVEKEYPIGVIAKSAPQVNIVAVCGIVLLVLVVIIIVR